MSRQLMGITLSSAMVIAFGQASTAEAQLLGSSKPLALPVTGSVSGGGTFVGTLSIQRFAARGSATVAVAAIAGAIVDAPVAGRTGLRATIELPVTVNSTLPIAAYRPRGPAFGAPRLVLARQTCSDAHIEIGGNAVVNIMDVQVTLNPAVVDVSAGTGGLIGSLVCQIGGLLGSPTLLASVLNQLLPQLVGLLGGLTGGLLL
jgi:hypothetical protein